MDCIYGVNDYKNRDVVCSLHGQRYCPWDYEVECPDYESRAERAKRIESSRKGRK